MEKFLKGLAFILTLTFTILGSVNTFGEINDTLNSENSLTSRKIFSKIEVPALEILPVSTRLDMLDYWDVDSIYKASNVMEGLSWIEDLTDDYIKIHITNVSSLEIKILPVKKGNIVMTIYTIGASPQAQDSQIDFYDENLIEVDRDKYFERPDLKEFFEIPRGSITSMKEIREMIPFPTVAYSVSRNENMLSARLTVEEYINQDDWNIIKLFLKPEIITDWKKDKFKF